MKETREFIELNESQIKNAELFHITARGPVLSLRNREDKLPSYLKDKYILWEALTYLVIGLELSQYPIDPRVGLVLRLIKEDNSEL